MKDDKTSQRIGNHCVSIDETGTVTITTGQGVDVIVVRYTAEEAQELLDWLYYWRSELYQQSPTQTL